MTLFFRPSKLTWENEAYISKTNEDNFTKFHMQLYWLIPHTFYFMTFDLQGHIRPLRLKQKYLYVFVLVDMSLICMGLSVPA